MTPMLLIIQIIPIKSIQKSKKNKTGHHIYFSVLLWHFKNMENCLFCSIFAKKIPASIVFENELVMAFKDLNPVSAIHILFIHKNHSNNAMAMVEENPQHIQDIYQAISLWSKTLGESSPSFRIISNVGALAGQSIFHTHFHVLGGQQLRWPGV